MTAERHHLVNSVTKSFVGMLTGTAVGCGLLGPDTLLAEYLPEFSQSKVAGNSGNWVPMKNSLNKKPRFGEAGMGNPGNVYSWTVEKRWPEV
jgi:CubicO group peptidase (beta-lactamase class C family)